MTEPTDLDALAAAWRRRRDDERAHLATRAAELREAVERASRVLVAEYGATEVWLFGSLVWGSLHARSDVDLAARGVPPERFFAALARVAAIVGEPVDLVPLETCAPGLRARMVRDGARLDGG